MYDPILLLLRFVVLRHFWLADLEKSEQSFVAENTKKHRVCLWITIVSSSLVLWGLSTVPNESLGTVIGGLLGPVVVFGGAWFFVSFGGIPIKLLRVAMSITLWMFSAFCVSLATMFIAVGFVSPPQIWPVLAFVFIAGWIACVRYDTADGLKAGLDEAQLHHSRAALTYYRNMGIEPTEKP
jgi:hypothetical protein